MTKARPGQVRRGLRRSGNGAVNTRRSYTAYLATWQAKGNPEKDVFRANIKCELLKAGEVLAHTWDKLVLVEMLEEVFSRSLLFGKQGIEEEEEWRRRSCNLPYIAKLFHPGSAHQCT